MIRSNVHKYSISAMCKVLRIARSTYYYESTITSDETELEDVVEAVFNENRKVYGSRKIKVALKKQGIILSRRKIIRIMKKRNLFSAYSICKFKVHKGSVNEAEIPNLSSITRSSMKFWTSFISADPLA